MLLTLEYYLNDVFIAQTTLIKIVMFNVMSDIFILKLMFPVQIIRSTVELKIIKKKVCSFYL